MKKQIVFVENEPTVYTLKIAKALKSTGRYETVLFCFSVTNEKDVLKSYDKIFSLNTKYDLSLDNILKFLKKALSKEGRFFFKKLKEIDPFLIQITGPNLFTILPIFFSKKIPKIYFPYDIWALFERKLSFKDFEVKGKIKEIIQRRTEKMCFKKADGIIHNGLEEELDLLDYKINCPKMLLQGLVDENMISKKSKRKDNEIHIGYAGKPFPIQGGNMPFMKTLRIITAQKIHLHTYGLPIDDSEENMYLRENKINKYYHYHKTLPPNELNKELSNYDYGILPGFYDASFINSLWPKISLANRMFNYIESNLPIIVNNQSEAMKDIVVGDKIGFSVNYLNLKNLRKIIQQQDYKKFLKNMKICQDKFGLSKKIKEIEDFYELVVNKSKFKK